MDVHVERERSLELTDVVRPAQPDEARLVLECMVELVDREAALSDEVEERAGVSRKRAPPWTTRWPTAATSSGAASSDASGSER